MRSKDGQIKYKTVAGIAPWIDGKESILEMKANVGPSWKEVEWPGYYIKYFLQNFCSQNTNCNVIPYDDKKRHLVKGNTLWDARVHDYKKDNVPLGDLTEYNNLIDGNNGIGVIVIDSENSVDRSGSFKEWHESLKGKSSEYSKQGRLLGRRSRPRKEKIRIKRAVVYFFKPGDLERGVKEGWATDDFQHTMKNASKPTRKNKYEIFKSKVPKENLLFIKDF